MARKSQILKLITVLAFAWLFIILLMYIFGSGKSYHYIHVERKLQMLQEEKVLRLQQLKAHDSAESVVKDGTDLKLDYEIKEPSSDELMTAIQKKVPNLPIEYYTRHSNQTMEKFKNCAQYPALAVLNFYNTYWQTLDIDNRIFQLYGAYYDERSINSPPAVRILAMTKYQENDFPIIYCQLWFENDNRPVLTTVKEFKIIWEKTWGLIPQVYYPYLMTCELPKNMNITGDPIPKVVNLVSRQCDTASNSLKVIYDKPKKLEEKQKFAVCVKGLDFPYEDLSSRIVEWLELLKLMGVHKVYMHQLEVHNNITKVLNYYRKTGFVEVQKTSLVGGVVDQPELEHWLIKSYKLNKRLNELIPYNDCFYRNMYKYEYIALLDIDEVIIPKNSLNNWQQLVEKTQNLETDSECSLGYASLCATNVYYPLKNVLVGSNPPYMFMLNHGYRVHNYTQKHFHVKCLHNTQHVITLHNHYPLTYSENFCRSLDLNTSDAQLQHYRDIESIKEQRGKSHKFYYDDSMERFREPLIERCSKVLKELKFIS